VIPDLTLAHPALRHLIALFLLEVLFRATRWGRLP